MIHQLTMEANEPVTEAEFLIELLKNQYVTLLLFHRGTGSLRLSMRGNYELEGTLTVHVPWWGPVKWPFSSTNKGDHL